MLNEQDILPELKQYQKVQQDYLSGKAAAEEEWPRLPENKDAPKKPSFCILGMLIHSILFVSIELSSLFRIKSFVVFFTKLRIATDKYSFEPVSCGYNYAYTKLGLVLLSQNDISGAINCLDASWRVHPCAHNTSYGLKRALVSKLKGYPEAQIVVDQYLSISKQFVYWPDKWAEKILRS